MHWDQLTVGPTGRVERQNAGGGPSVTSVLRGASEEEEAAPPDEMLTNQRRRQPRQTRCSLTRGGGSPARRDAH